MLRAYSLEDQNMNAYSGNNANAKEQLKSIFIVPSSSPCKKRVSLWAVVLLLMLVLALSKFVVGHYMNGLLTLGTFFFTCALFSYLAPAAKKLTLALLLAATIAPVTVSFALFNHLWTLPFRFTETLWLGAVAVQLVVGAYILVRELRR